MLLPWKLLFVGLIANEKEVQTKNEKYFPPRKRRSLVSTAYYFFYCLHAL